MNIIYYLIPVAILFIVIGVVVFFWATKTEQFEDLEKQGFSILSDDDVKPNVINNDNKTNK
ncbi:MAG: cbb3-type cytochrome oxidase assembly protein CcoS [Gammaproteobacteria bacterium]|nr:cbb3-type cytochrome oxidase assembly protein CcoS [Gammaproteobacteria bacterium]